MSNDAFRIEKDSLGEVRVPKDALFGAQTQRAINNFSISDTKMPRAFIRALGLIKYASAQVNIELELLDSKVGEAIQESALEVAKGIHDEDFPVDVFQTGSGTSTNMNANEVIANLASKKLSTKVHPNDHVNMGQSSNDVIPSAIHLSASTELTESLLPALNHLISTIERKSKKLDKTFKTGRTHLMDALPITMGQELSAWAQQLTHCLKCIDEGFVRLSELAIGGTAVGTGLNTHEYFGEKVCGALSVMVGFKVRPKENYFEALSCQDTALEMSGNLKTLATSLLKISNDLRWMNSGPTAGLAEIELPSLQPGSSIMPGKVNPVIPEAVAQVAAKVMGNDTTITFAAQSGSFQLNHMLPLIGVSLLESINILSRSMMSLADLAIADFSVKEQNLNRSLAKNPIIATALNKHIGYDAVAKIVKVAFKENRDIIDVASEMTEFSREQLKEILDPSKLVSN